jgi:choline dehydrogenase-like flavoprotein
VIDPEPRVRGAGRLRVIDTSVMPRRVSATAHAAALTIGERVRRSSRRAPERIALR